MSADSGSAALCSWIQKISKFRDAAASLHFFWEGYKLEAEDVKVVQHVSEGFSSYSCDLWILTLYIYLLFVVILCHKTWQVE